MVIQRLCKVTVGNRSLPGHTLHVTGRGNGHNDEDEKASAEDCAGGAVV